MRFRRWWLRKQHRLIRWRKRGGVWFLAFAILFALLYQTLWLVERNLKPTLTQVAEAEVKKVTGDALREAVKDQGALGEELDQLIRVEKDHEGRIQFIQINQQLQAQIFEKMHGRMVKELDILSDKPMKVNLGKVLQSNLLADYGPELPLEIWAKAAPRMSLKPRIQAEGINTVMVTLILEVQTEVNVIIPFSTDSMKIRSEYPLAQAVVMGEVPRYYYYNDMGKIKRSEGESQGQSGQMPMLPPVQVDEE